MAGSFLQELKDDDKDENALKQPEVFVPADEIEDFSHNFHKVCLFEWMKFNKDCPVCRTQIRTENMDWNLLLSAKQKAGYA